MLNLSTRASAKSAASDRARARTFTLVALLVFVSGIFWSFPVAKANALPFDLLTLQVNKTADSVRIEIAASRSLEDATIEESAGAREVSIRILGASSHLRPTYSGADRLVQSVRTISGGQDDKTWVEIVIDIDEGTAVTFRKVANLIVIEATNTSYFSLTRNRESSDRSSTNNSNRTAVTNSRVAIQPQAESSSSKKTTDKSAQLNKDAKTSQQAKLAPSPPVNDQVQLLDLNIRRISGTPRIEILADRSVASLVVEQSAGATETLLRIRGARSLLEPKYSSADLLIYGVRTVSGGQADAPWVDLIIETAQGTAISTRKNSSRLEIEVSKIAYFRRAPSSDKQIQTATRSAPSPTQSMNADPAQPVASNSNGLQVASTTTANKETANKSVTQTAKTSEPAKNVSSAKASVHGSPSTASTTIPTPLRTEQNAAANAQISKPVSPVTNSAETAKSLTEAESKSRPSTVSSSREIPVLATSPTIIVSAAQEKIEGQLHGVVVDEMGALVVGAAIVLDDGHEHKYTTKTDERGRYEIKGMLPGKYVLTATSEGFAVFKQEIEIEPKKMAALDVTLKILISAQVEVRARPNNDLSGTILTGSDIDALPKNPTQLLQTLRQMATMMGIPDASIVVDGSEGERLPPKEDIQMIKISPHSFAAEYAQPTAGRIEVTSKPSGHFHGDFSFNFNDEALNARDPFAPTRAPLQIREYNGYLSGPIIPGRWSFSTYLGRYEQDENSVVNAIVLNPATLAFDPFATTVLTPSRQSYFSFGTSYLMRHKHTFRIKYARSDGNDSTRGVGGFDLPERGYNSSSRDQEIAVSLISLFADNKINELYLRASRNRSRTRALTSVPAVIVLDSFSAGGNQESLFTDNSSDRLNFSDSFTFPHKNHLLKAGIGLASVRLQDVDRGNFGGTFTFGSDFERDGLGNPRLDADGQPITISSLEHYRRTVLGLPGYRPSQFAIVRGNPSVGLSQSDFLWYAQDDWKLSSRLVFSYGLRQTFQSNLRNKLNFAPRLGLAMRVSKKRNDTIRAGIGFFYSNVPSNIILDTVKLDGRHQQEIIVQRPSFFPDVPGTVTGTDAQPTIRTKDPNLRSPYSILSTVRYQPEMPWGLSGSVSYTWQRGVHLLRSRNINAPVPGTPGLRPLMNFGRILQFESTGRLQRHALGFSLSKDISSKFSLSGGYTFTVSRSDTDGPYAVPANSYDLSNEPGPTSGVSRHNFRLEAWSSLPWGFNLSPYFSISSGTPFDITTGRDNNSDTLFTDRPAFGNLGQSGVVVTRFGSFNLNPGPGDLIIPRNFGRGARTISTGLNLYKSFSFGSGGDESTGSVFNRARKSVRGPYSLTLSTDIENLFNHTNFSDFNGVLTSPFFGRANSSDNPRKIKVGLELSF